MNPVCVSTWHGEGAKHWHAFMATAKRNGIEPQNADDTFWPGTTWQDKEWFRKSQAQYRFVRDHRDDYDLVLFVDSHDVLFATGWDEIMRKFLDYESPIVFGAECYPWPNQQQAADYPASIFRCRYLNAGFWMAESGAAMALLTDIEQVAAKRLQCDQGIAVDAYLSKRHPIKLDSACSLCFCCNMDSLNYLDLSNGRPYAKDTQQEPCMFHGNGNSPLHTVAGALDAYHARYRPSAEEVERMSE